MIELKWGKTAKSGKEQIKERNDLSTFEDYHGEILLVAINYNKSSKSHECLIESIKR